LIKFVQQQPPQRWLIAVNETSALVCVEKAAFLGVSFRPGQMTTALMLPFFSQTAFARVPSMLVCVCAFFMTPLGGAGNILLLLGRDISFFERRKMLLIV